MEGYIEMNRVPGLFYISTMDFADIIYTAQQKGYYSDLSYRIDHFSFGKKLDFDSIRRNYPNTDIKHPLDGFEHEASFTRRNTDKPHAHPF